MRTIINLQTVLVASLVQYRTPRTLRAYSKVFMYENPFDQMGEDDVVINAEKFVERLALDPVDPRG